MPIKKTIAEILNFNMVAKMYIARHEKKENKICAAIKHVQKNQFTKVQEQFNSDLDNARIECCAVDSEGTLLLDKKGGYRYSPEGMKKLKEKIKELNKKTYDIVPKLFDGVKELVAKMSEQEKNAFNGIIIPPFAAKKEEE